MNSSIPISIGATHRIVHYGCVQPGYLMIEMLDVVHQVVVEDLVVGVNDAVQVREVAVEVDVVGVGATGQEILPALIKFDQLFSIFFLRPYFH